MKGATEYIDASKDTWRGWKWNAIARACLSWNDRLSQNEQAKRLSKKTVLYLVGPEDHDRRKALVKGFASHNLIAIDLVQDRVDEVRRQGGLAIRGSLQTILMNWPHDWLIDVVDADLCSGLVNDVGEIPNCLFLSRAIHAETVISLNLMRGRDAHSNVIRDGMRSFIEPLMPDGYTKTHHDVVKHRGSNWLFQLAQHWRQVRDLAEGLPEQMDELGRRGVFLNPIEVSELFESWRPQVSSYRSKTSGQVFDSVVHRWAFQMMDQEGIHKSVWTDHREAVKDKLSDKCSGDLGLKERIAALRAVRTTKVRKLERA